MTKPQHMAVADTQLVPGPWLVGMVSERKFSRIPDEPYAEIRVSLEETADLIEVVPMDTIDECVQLAMAEEALR